MKKLVYVMVTLMSVGFFASCHKNANSVEASNDSISNADTVVIDSTATDSIVEVDSINK